MTNEERVAALQGMGYQKQEARFLSLAALHSGYFLRRQFLSFMSVTKGWRDDSFITKLETREHCRSTAYRHNRTVYRLCSKPFFTALGEPDNRNRREKQPATVKNRLMALDFVLEHQSDRYLATESEKVEHFTTLAGVPLAHLPTKRYQSRTNGQVTLRYFVEKFPIFLADSGNGDTEVHFCYVNEGLVSADAFQTFLTQYQALLSRLPRYRIVYIAGQFHLVDKAAAIFQAMHRSINGSVPADPMTQDLLHYFATRRKYESRDFSGLDAARIIEYRDQKRRFVGAGFDDLYQRWLLDGDAAVLSTTARESAASDSLSSSVGSFDSYILRHNYDLFGTI